MSVTNIKGVKITLILPSVSSGGLERVLTELSWYFSEQEGVEVSLISLMKGDFFYPLPEHIQVFSPYFSIKDMPRFIFLLRLMYWLRRQVRTVKPDALLSFGGKFNSFVLISVFGIKVRTYVSDRSRPSISYGRFLDWLNSIMYRRANGIIAQTNLAKEIMQRRIDHPNIMAIGNPLKINGLEGNIRENIILNVGRFIPSKQQALLVRYFASLQPIDWKLVFLGDGRLLEDVRQLTHELGLEKKIEFTGAVQNIYEYYYRSKIFAFTSISEGFPNALGEAMAAGLACISFDCEAGPSDLIDNGINGFLIEENDHETYKGKLELLINEPSLVNDFGQKAIQKVKKFSLEQIGRQYLIFLTERKYEADN